MTATTSTTPLFDAILEQVKSLPAGGCEHCGHKWFEVATEQWDAMSREWQGVAGVPFGNWFVYKDVTVYRAGSRPEKVGVING